MVLSKVCTFFVNSLFLSLSLSHSHVLGGALSRFHPIFLTNFGMHIRVILRAKRRASGCAHQIGKTIGYTVWCNGIMEWILPEASAKETSYIYHSECLWFMGPRIIVDIYLYKCIRIQFVNERCKITPKKKEETNFIVDLQLKTIN